MNGRKISQMVSSKHGVVVLCDDNTMWEMHNDTVTWCPLADVPMPIEDGSVPVKLMMMTQKDFDNWKAEVWLTIDHNQCEGYKLRNGQIMFNVLFDRHPDIANQIRGTQYDPFHETRNENDFFNYIHTEYVL